MHQLLCWFFQGCILAGSHTLAGLHAIWLFIGLGSLVTSNTVGLRDRSL